MQDYAKFQTCRPEQVSEGLRQGWEIIGASGMGDASMGQPMFHMGLPATVVAKDYGTILNGLIASGAIERYVEAVYPEQFKEFQLKSHVDHADHDDDDNSEPESNIEYLCKKTAQKYDDPVLSLYVRYAVEPFGGRSLWRDERLQL